MSFPVRCHHCKQWVGESSQPMEWVGVFKDPWDVERVAGPRDTWRCKACGWATVFKIATVTAEVGSWRQVEVKRSA